MAPKRKVTLADIQGPQGKPRLSPPGRVALPRGIRPKRYEPKRDPLNFALLSKTLGNIAGAVGEKLAENEALEGHEAALEHLGLEDRALYEFELAMRRVVGNPEEEIPFSEIPGLNQFDVGPIGFPEGTEIPRSPALLGMEKELSDAVRAGKMPVTAHPSVPTAKAKLLGGLLAKETWTEFKQHINHDGNYPVHGKPEYTTSQRITEVFYNKLKANPSLDRESDAFIPSAYKDFIASFAQYASEYTEKVAMRLAATAPGNIEKQIISPAFFAAVDSIVTVVPKSLTANKDPKKWGEYTQKAADNLERTIFDLIHQRTGVDFDPASLKRRLMVSALHQIKRDNPNNNWEMKEQLRLVMAVFEKMKIGTVDALQDHKFSKYPMHQQDLNESVDHAFNKLMEGGSGVGRGGRGGQGSGDAEEFVTQWGAEMIGEYTAKQAQASADVRSRATDHKGDYSDTTVFAFRESRESFRRALVARAVAEGRDPRQVNEIGYVANKIYDKYVGEPRTAQSALLSGDLLRTYRVDGDLGALRRNAEHAFVHGPLTLEDQEHLRKFVEDLDKTTKYMGPGSSFAAVFHSVNEVLGGLPRSVAAGGHGLPVSVTAPFALEYAKLRTEVISLFPAAIAEAESNNTSEQAALDKLMSPDGAGGKLVADFLKTVTDRRTAIDEQKTLLQTATSEGRRVNPTEIATAREIMGTTADLYVANNRRATDLDTLRNSLSSTLTHSLTQIENAVRKHYRVTEAKPTHAGAVKRKLEIESTSGIVRAKFSQDVNTLLRDFVKDGHKEFKVNLRGRIGELSASAIGLVAETAKLSEKESATAMAINKGKAASKGIGVVQRLNQEETEEKLKGRFIQPALKRLQAYAKDREVWRMGQYGHKIEDAATVFSRYFATKRFNPSDADTRLGDMDMYVVSLAQAIVDDTEDHPERRNQLLYDLYGLAGRIPMSAIEEGSIKIRYSVHTENRFTSGGFPRTQAIPPWLAGSLNFEKAARGRGYGGTLESKVITIDLTKVNLNPQFPHFGKQSEIEKFYKDPARYAPFASRLFGKPWDPKRNPLDSQDLDASQSRAWILLQRDVVAGTPMSAVMRRSESAFKAKRAERRRQAAGRAPGVPVTPPTVTPPPKKAKKKKAKKKKGKGK